MHPSYAMSISDTQCMNRPGTVFHAQICMKETCFTGRKTSSQGSKPLEADLTGMQQQVQLAAGSIRPSKLLAAVCMSSWQGPERRPPCYRDPLKALWGRPKLLDLVHAGSCFSGRTAAATTMQAAYSCHSRQQHVHALQYDRAGARQ